MSIKIVRDLTQLIAGIFQQIFIASFRFAPNVSNNRNNRKPRAARTPFPAKTFRTRIRERPAASRTRLRVLHYTSELCGLVK